MWWAQNLGAWLPHSQHKVRCCLDASLHLAEWHSCLFPFPGGIQCLPTVSSCPRVTHLLRSLPKLPQVSLQLSLDSPSLAFHPVFSLRICSSQEGPSPWPGPHTQGPAANWLLVSMTPLGDCEDKEETLERDFSSKMLFVVTGQEKVISLGEDLTAGHSLMGWGDRRWMSCLGHQWSVDFHLFIKLNYLHEGVGCCE